MKNKKEIEQILMENIFCKNIGEFFFFCDEILRNAFYVNFYHFDDEEYKLLIGDEFLMRYQDKWQWVVNKYCYFVPHKDDWKGEFLQRIRGDKLVNKLLKLYKDYKEGKKL